MAFQVTPQMEAFIKALPKTETHLHIEGALPYDLIQAMHPEKYAELPASWSNDFKFRDFHHFEEELLGFAADWYHTPERYHEAAKLVFKRLKEEQNVKYISCSFASGVIEFTGMNGQVVAEGIKAAVPDGVKLDLYMGIHHPGYNEKSKAFIEESLAWDALDGYDLHGVETLPIEEWTPDFWKRAKAAGKLTKAHAGEYCGPDFIAKIIKDLDVNRIQHGVRSVYSDDFMEQLRREDIVLDVCPISNYKLALAHCYDEHKGLPLLRDEKICCTISTDDPVSFGNTLFDDYAFLVNRHDFTAKELGRLAKNGFITSTLSQKKIKSFCEQIDALVSTYSS